MRAGSAPAGWYLTALGRRVRVVGPGADARYVQATDHTGRPIDLPVGAELTLDLPAEVELHQLVPGGRGACAACGWVGSLTQAGARWVLPPHGDGLACRGSGRTPGESELLTLPGGPTAWVGARTVVQRAVVVRATSDLAWLEHLYDAPDLQAEVRREMLAQRDAIHAIEALAGDGPGLRKARRRSAVRARPGVRHRLDQLLREAKAVEDAQRLAAARVLAARAAFRRRAGVAPAPRLYPLPAPPQGPDPLVEELARDAALSAPALLVDDLAGLDAEARLLLEEHPRCPLTDLDWTRDRLVAILVWGRRLSAHGVLVLSRSLSRAVVDPTPWARRLDPETASHVLLAAAARAAEAADVPPGGRTVRSLALASLPLPSPEHAGALAVRALRSLWAGGVRATLTLESE